jgi:putative salt-induced outer membrane protein YdiY
LYFKWLFRLWVLLTLSVPSLAGVLELKSGDRILGEVVRLEGDELVWNSSIAGEIRVQKSDIANLYSSMPMKISGFRRACIMEKVDDEDLVYYCGARVNLRRIPLLSLRTLLPYSDYVTGVYRTAGKINLWGAYSSGNEVRNEWNIQGEARVRIDEVRHVVNGEYANASWNKASNKVRWNGGYSFEWFYRPQWFSYNSLSSGRDENRGLERQWILGSGLGHQFYETSNAAFSQQLGLAYMDQQYEELKIIEKGFDESVQAIYLRTATDFRYVLFENVSVFHTNEFMYSLDDNEDWHLRTSSGLSSRILEQIVSEVKLEYWVDNMPQPTKAREDVRLSVGFGYQW